MKFDFYLENFLNYMLSEKNASNLTIISYKKDISLAAEFFLKRCMNPSIEEINVELIRKFIVFMKIEKKYSVSSLRRKIYVLSSYYKYMVQMEYIIKNPMLVIRAPKRPIRIPIYLSKDEVELLLKTPMISRNENSMRDQIFLYLTYFGGMRRSEIIKLDFDNIDFNEKTIKILNAKGNKDRIIPMHPRLEDKLWAYLQTRLPLTNHAVISTSYGRMSAPRIDTIFGVYRKIARLENKGFTLHKLRHSFATHLIQNGANLFVVQELLGHKDLDSTRIYSHVSMNDKICSVMKL